MQSEDRLDYFTPHHRRSRWLSTVRHPGIRWLQLVAFCTWAFSPMQVGRAEWVTQDNNTIPFGEYAWHWLDGNSTDQYTLLSSLGSSSDADGDGLSNDQEASWGTDPYNPDTDSDGHTDGNEVFYDLTNPAVWNYFAPPSVPDTDSDGFDDNSDPAPNDSANYSSTNQTSWYADALNDGDNDGTPNFYDTTPWPSVPTSDDDGDGLLNGVDPAPQDWVNYSGYNNLSWPYASALDDADGDGSANFYDSSPYDPPPSGNPPGSSPPPSDMDLDGIPDGNDPAPNDPSNTSPVNGSAWYGTAATENSDGDSFANFFDPAPSDSTNYSSANLISWNEGAMNDDDGDGQANFFDSEPWPQPAPDPGTVTDADGDGLTDAEESGYGTNSTMIDTDSDGLTDFEELRTYHTDPLNAYSIHESHPLTTPNSTDFYLVDMTDQDEGIGDGIPDWVETFYGLNPTNASDAYGDLDGDGVSNFDQYQAGIPLNANLVRFDADLDGMTSVFEQHFQLNDGVFDDSVEDSDNDGLFNFEEASLVLHPRSATTRMVNGIALLDWSILVASGRLLATDLASRVNAGDWDADGLPDAWEHRYGLESNPAGGMKIRTPDAAADYDGDSVTNAEEFALGFNPLIQETQAGTNDSVFDRDGDGLSDAFELRHGFDFASAAGDADNDGVTDAQELAEGTDPHDAASSSRVLIGLKVISPLERGGN